MKAMLPCHTSCVLDQAMPAKAYTKNVEGTCKHTQMMTAQQSAADRASDQALTTIGLAEQECCVYTSALFWPVIQLQGIQLCSNSCSWGKQM